MADTRILDTATQILSEVASRLAAAGISVPTYQYVHSGEIAHDFAGEDCVEALIVSWGGTFQGLPGAEAGASPIRCAVPLTAGFSVALLRCVPTLDSQMNPPSQAQLQASGEEILLDAATLPVVIIDAELDGELVPFGCSLVGMADASPVGPQGGVGGVVVNLVVGLL